MGCKECKSSENSESSVKREILKCILSENISSLSHNLKSYIRSKSHSEKEVIDIQVVYVGDFKLSLLAYAFVSGSSKSFRLLHEKFSASIKKMLKLFAEFDINPLNTLCEKNHSEMLKYFLPLYFRYRSSTSSKIMDNTIEFQNEVPIAEEKISFTPIQVACLCGSVQIVNFLYNYNLEYPHPWINIEEINEETGESCALLAVRSGSLTTVKLLNEKYGMKFNTVNSFNENALQICAVCSNRVSGQSGFFEIFVYLIEEVGLDPLWNYEEILMILSDREMVLYFESVLSYKGVDTSKQEIDKKNEFNKVKKESEAVDVKVESRSHSYVSSIREESQGTQIFSESLRKWFIS